MIGPVLFDLDGCLVDSRPGIFAAVRAAQEALGLAPQTDDELAWLIGPPLGPGFAEVLRRQGGDPDRWPDLLAAYRATYVDSMLPGTTLVDGIEAVVRRVADHGLVGVVTSKPTAFARPILDHVGVLDAFVVVEGPSLDAPDEPKAVTLARALAQLDGRATATMVGDRHHDIDAGRAHGLRTIGVTWGIGDRTELEVAGADVVVDSPAELLTQLAPA